MLVTIIILILFLLIFMFIDYCLDCRKSNKDIDNHDNNI